MLRADACVLRRRAVTSHQTAAPRPLAWSPVSPSAIIFPFPFVSRLSDVTLILLWNRHRFNSKGVAYTYDRCVFTYWKMEMCGKPSAPKQTRAGTSAFGVGIDKPPLKKMGFEAKPLLFVVDKVTKCVHNTIRGRISLLVLVPGEGHECTTHRPSSLFFFFNSKSHKSLGSANLINWHL